MYTINNHAYCNTDVIRVMSWWLGTAGLVRMPVWMGGLPAFPEPGEHPPAVTEVLGPGLRIVQLRKIGYGNSLVFSFSFRLFSK